MKSGEIIFCKKFEFFDGFTKDKYFVVLNDPQPDENFLVALTTTQELYAGETKRRPSIPGCHAPDLCFFIAPNTEWFQKPTWVCFDFYEFNQQQALKNEQAEQFKRKSAFSQLRFQALLTCLRHSHDLTGDQVRLISTSLVKIPR